MLQPTKQNFTTNPQRKRNLKTLQQTVNYNKGINKHNKASCFVLSFLPQVQKCNYSLKLLQASAR